MSITTVVGHVSSIEFKATDNGGFWKLSVAENNGYKGKNADTSYTIWYNFIFDSNTFTEEHPILSRTKKGNVVEVVGRPSYKLTQYTSIYNEDKNSLSLSLDGVSIQWRQIGQRDEGDDTSPTSTRKPRDVSQFEEQEIA